MGIKTTTVTVTICTCDRCGLVKNMNEYDTGNAWGQCKVKWVGDEGSRTYAGDAGGLSHRGEAWLCRVCAEDFYGFMKEKRSTK